MRVEYVVPGLVEHRTAEVLAEMTGLEIDEIYDNLRGFLESAVEESLIRLRTDTREQDEFVAFVVERKKRATALAEAAALTQVG